jgi:hypothetical protein
MSGRKLMEMTSNFGYHKTPAEVAADDNDRHVIY